jgi:uncharacterized protein YbjT (DUF2867 family)
MVITVIGATGFLGKNLIKHILQHTSHSVRAFSRSAADLPMDSPRLEKIAGSIFEPKELADALTGADAAVYLFHMMGSHDQDFAEGEADAAAGFVAAAKRSGLRKLVFFGGLGDDTDPKLSKHLASRHNTGTILRNGLPGCQVLELQASMVMSEGSVGFDIIRSMADKLPVIIIPTWAITLTQPIMLDDAISYITACLTLPPGVPSQIIEIGGPEHLTYRDIAMRYARQTAKKRHWNRIQPVFTVPLIPRQAAVWWLERFASSKSAGIGGPMVDSLQNEMIVHKQTAGRLFPDIRPRKVEFVDLAALPD